MARHDLHLHSDACLDCDDARPPIDTLIRSGLHKVFPLPAKEQAPDKKFQLLLAALAGRNGANGQPPLSLAGKTS